VEIEVIRISFSEITDETLQLATLHDDFGFVEIFSRSNGERSSVFSTGE
jgi:hypothetical protein